MISVQQVENLSRLRSDDHLISTLYLRLTPDPRVHRRQLKDLIKEQEERFVQENIPEEEKASIREDFEIMRDFVENFSAPPHKGLVIFSSQAERLWKVFPLARPVRDLLLLDHTAYVRPLIGILDGYRRIATLLVDRQRARFFEIYMGEIEERSEVLSDGPARVKKGGLYGYTERKIERHIDFHLHNHLKKVAENAYGLFRAKSFDWLLLGGQPEIVPEIEKALHSSLRERVKKTFRMDVRARPHEILAKTLELESEIKKEEDESLVKRLENSLGGEGLGVTGLQETLSSLYEGSVHTLLVEENFSLEGAYCRQCGYMGLSRGACPVCQGEMVPVPDIIEEAEAAAIDQNCEIVHVHSGNGLAKLGRIGAFLRFKT